MGDRNERLEFLLPRKETKIGTTSYGKLIYHANLGGIEVLAKIVTGVLASQKVPESIC